MLPAWLRRVNGGKTDFSDISRVFIHLNVRLMWMQSALWIDVWIFYLTDFTDILFPSPASLHANTRARQICQPSVSFTQISREVHIKTVLFWNICHSLE